MSVLDSGRWPEGLVCEYCARLGMRTSGACATCGHIGGLPGLDEQRRPTCRSCSGISLPLDCPGCGAEGQLYRAGTCIRCALGDDVYLLLGGPKGIIPTPLLPLAEAIKTMPSARSGITWLQSPKVKGLLPEGSRPIVGQVEPRRRTRTTRPLDQGRRHKPCPFRMEPPAGGPSGWRDLASDRNPRHDNS